VNLPTKSGDYSMPDTVLQAYRRVYPSADYEFAQMVIWLETHATRRPASPKSAPRFVANWFKRVPRIAPRADARQSTIAALTGVSNVYEIGAAAGGMGGANFRADERRVRGAEDVVDVDWRESGQRQALLG
jgi:hypothetical protein